MLPRETKFYEHSIDSSEKKMKLRPNQQLGKQIMDLSSGLGSLGELVLLACEGLFHTAKEFSKLTEIRIFVGYEDDSACFQHVIPSLLKLYVKWELSPLSDMARTGDAHK